MSNCVASLAGSVLLIALCGSLAAGQELALIEVKCLYLSVTPPGDVHHPG